MVMTETEHTTSTTGSMAKGTGTGKSADTADAANNNSPKRGLGTFASSLPKAPLVADAIAKAKGATTKKANTVTSSMTDFRTKSKAKGLGMLPKKSPLKTMAAKRQTGIAATARSGGTTTRGYASLSNEVPPLDDDAEGHGPLEPAVSFVSEDDNDGGGVGDDDFDSYSIIDQGEEDEEAYTDDDISDRDDAFDYVDSPRRLDSEAIEGRGSIIATAVSEGGIVAPTPGSLTGNHSDSDSDDESSLLDQDDYIHNQFTMENELRTLRQQLANAEERNRRLEAECADAAREAEREAARIYVEEKERTTSILEEAHERALAECREENERRLAGLTEEIESLRRELERKTEDAGILLQANIKHKSTNEMLRARHESSNERLNDELERSKANCETLLRELNDAKAESEACPFYETRVNELLEELKRRDLEVECLRGEICEVREFYRRQQKETSEVIIKDNNKAVGGDLNNPNGGGGRWGAAAGVGNHLRASMERVNIHALPSISPVGNDKDKQPNISPLGNNNDDDEQQQEQNHRGPIVGWGRMSGLKESIVKGIKEKQQYRQEHQPTKKLSNADKIKALQQMDRQQSNASLSQRKNSNISRQSSSGGSRHGSAAGALSESSHARQNAPVTTGEVNVKRENGSESSSGSSDDEGFHEFLRVIGSREEENVENENDNIKVSKSSASTGRKEGGAPKMPSEGAIV